ncbi:uncharacterized protein LOC135817610 isoform X1 [Sycon ciliatum]|uniref:uncharacterized protein LOC135817610 isoform X1 n=2 Tax=Sycon ciliatum TaxID=27933 RepID=UPI0031F6B33D
MLRMPEQAMDIGTRRSVPKILLKRSSSKALKYATAAEPVEQLDVLVNNAACTEGLPRGEHKDGNGASGGGNESDFVISNSVSDIDFNCDAADATGVSAVRYSIDSCNVGCSVVTSTNWAHCARLNASRSPAQRRASIWIRRQFRTALSGVRRAMRRCASVFTICVRSDKRMPASSVDSNGCRNCRMPLELSQNKVNVLGPILPIINPGADSWVEGWHPESSQYGLPHISSTSVVTEESVIGHQDMNSVELDTPEDERYYRDYFMSRTHVNYCAMDCAAGPMVMSVRYDDVTTPPCESSHFRVIIRTRDRTICKRISSQLVGDESQVEDIARIALPDLNPSLRFQCTVSTDVQNALLEYDEHAKQCRFKFGILTQALGQTTEEAIFSNNTVSDQFSQFLNCIATQVDLQGFEGFRGGLDVKGNLSGRSSYFAKFKNREIMFHVSPLMPFSKTDAQQVARKRHIGNDIVCVVFQEESTTFDPNWIASSFLHTYIVVQPVTGTAVAANLRESFSASSPQPETFYRISVCSKKSVPPFSPLLPSTGVFPVTKEFGNLFLTLLINAERSSTKAEQFAKLERRTREYLLKDLHQCVLNSCDTAEVNVRDSGRWAGVRRLMPSKKNRLSGVPNTPSQSSIASQTSQASQTSTTESMAKEGKGLLHFFRAGSSTNLRGSRNRSAATSTSSPGRTSSGSLASLVTLPNNLDTREMFFKSESHPDYLDMDGPLVRSSSVISADQGRSPKSFGDMDAEGDANSPEVFPTARLPNGDDFPLVADASAESLSSAVCILRNTVASLKEERLQLLREDVAIRAKLAESEAREAARERELLEARNEIAQLQAKLALSSLNSSDKLKKLNFTDATSSNSIHLADDGTREGMRV